MEFFKQNTRIDFMSYRKHAISFSIILFFVSMIAYLIMGLNLSLDFTGGTKLVVEFNQTVKPHDLREQMKDHDITQFSLQSYGTSNQVLISFGSQKNSSMKNENQKQGNYQQLIENIFPEATIKSTSYIGPQMGEVMLLNGILAIIVSLIVTMLYIALRFEYRFAVAAAISLIHDPVVILGVFSIFQIEFNLITLASLLMTLGYSINDTIVVYDRIRENYRKIQKMTSYEIVNLSINQTLSRTIMTSGLTLLVVLALFFFGGDSLLGFSTAFIIGILVGTYSSIYIAGSIAVAMGFTRQSLLPLSTQTSE